MWWGRDPSTEQLQRDHDETRERLAGELAKLRAEVAALRAERDQTKELTQLKRSISDLQITKDQLVETNDRKIRETEHRVGLLRTQQEHEVANSTREAVLKVREENLDADKQRFKDEMDFQRTHLQREVDRVENILTKVLERLPNIDATFTTTRRERSVSD